MIGYCLQCQQYISDNVNQLVIIDNYHLFMDVEQHSYNVYSIYV